MSQASSPEQVQVPHVKGRIRGGRLLIIFVAALLLAALGLAYYFLQPSHSQSTIALQRGDIRATVTSNARVRAVKSARLSFPLSGLVAHMNVQEGDPVKAGDVLAQLQPDEFDRRVKQAGLALASHQLDLERAQAAPRAEDLQIAEAGVKKAALALGVAEDNAKKNPSNSNDAVKQAAQSDYDIAQANLDRLTRGPSLQELQALKNAIVAAQLDLDAAQAQRALTELRAPYDGIVTEINAQPGELIGGYNPVVGLADTRNLELLAEIDEIDVGNVAAGQNVEIRFDAFPGELLNGKVIQVFPAASTERGALIYHARISLDPGKLYIRPGMGATCKIATVEKKGVWLLPSRAIKNAGSQKIVSALVDGTIRDLVVETGLSDGTQTEIVSGLQPGTPVVVD